MEYGSGGANQTFRFLNFSPFGGGVGGGAGKKCKEMFGFASASPRTRPRRSPAQSGRTLRVHATTHAERAKWVRAKVSMSPQSCKHPLVALGGVGGTKRGYACRGRAGGIGKWPIMGYTVGTGFNKVVI